MEWIEPNSRRMGWKYFLCHGSWRCAKKSNEIFSIFIFALFCALSFTPFISRTACIQNQASQRVKIYNVWSPFWTNEPSAPDCRWRRTLQWKTRQSWKVQLKKSCWEWKKMCTKKSSTYSRLSGCTLGTAQKRHIDVDNMRVLFALT